MQTLQNRRFDSAVLCEGLDMPFVRVETVQKTVDFPQLQVLTWWSTSLLCSSCSWVVQFLDKVVDMPVGMQLSGFAEPCSKLWSFRSCSSSTSLVHVPVVMQRLVPMFQTVQLGLEAWAAHYFDD